MSHAAPCLISDAHQKSRWLDGLRGVAAALVALNHAPLTLINAHINPKVFYFPLTVHPLFHLLGGFGVQLFFCTTGMLFAGKLLFAEAVDWTEFFTKRLRRILPAYLVAILVALVFIMWMTHSTSIDPASIPGLFSFGMMLLPNINGFESARVIGVTWTLAFEWRYYMALPIVFVMSRRYPLGALALLTALAFADALLTDQSIWVYFVSGAIASLLVKRDFTVWVRRAALLIAVAAIAAAFWGWQERAIYGFQQWITVTVLFSMLAIAKPRALSLRPIVALGTVSYSFYLFHLMTLLFVMTVCAKWFFDPAYLTVRTFTMLEGGSLVLATCIATASYLLIERPFMRSPHAPRIAAAHIGDVYADSAFTTRSNSD